MCLKSAGLAVQSGYTNVRVMVAGEPAWVEAGNSTYASFGFVCQGDRILIDLRSITKSEESRISRSISMPLMTLENTIDDIPLKAPVVLYSDNKEETLAALQIFQDKGYKKLSLVEGGYHGWVQMGGKLDEGPVVTEVHWKRRLSEGEISLADFNKVLADPTQAIILDVRTNDEAINGKLKQSHHIPLDELSSRLDELLATLGKKPNEQKIYIHCTTGARAEMAYYELKYKDHNAYYLIAEVTCNGNDCVIEE